jgi:hypothetical protein
MPIWEVRRDKNSTYDLYYEDRRLHHEVPSEMLKRILLKYKLQDFEVGYLLGQLVNSDTAKVESNTRF